MEAYILDGAALRSSFCLASPSGNCVASLARASACSSKWSAVKNATLFLLRMPRSFRGVQIAVKPFEGFGLRRAGHNLRLLDVATACAAQRPMLVPRSRRRDALHHANAPATVAPGSRQDPGWRGRYWSGHF
jgi:hypothetical protein